VKTLTGFHAVTSRLRQKPDTIKEIYVDAERKDGRAKDLRELAKRHDVRVIAVDMKRLDGMAGGVRHLEQAYGVRPDVVTGPATDNRVGVRFVEREVGLPAINARNHARALGDHLLSVLSERNLKRA